MKADRVILGNCRKKLNCEESLANFWYEFTYPISDQWGKQVTRSNHPWRQALWFSLVAVIAAFVGCIFRHTFFYGFFVAGLAVLVKRYAQLLNILFAF
jgi:hypothetical protein